MRATDRHIAGERIMAAIEDLTESGFEVCIKTDVSRDGRVGWLVVAKGDTVDGVGFGSSIEGALREALGGALDGLAAALSETEGRMRGDH